MLYTIYNKYCFTFSVDDKAYHKSALNIGTSKARDTIMEPLIISSYIFIFHTEDKYIVHLIHPNRMTVHSVSVINGECIIYLLNKLSLRGLLRVPHVFILFKYLYGNHLKI